MGKGGSYKQQVCWTADASVNHDHKMLGCVRDVGTRVGVIQLVTSPSEVRFRK